MPVLQGSVGEQLTDTQQRILAALAQPLRDETPFATPATNREIADEVFLSVDAVKGHLRALYAKFDLADLPQNAKRARLAEIALSGQLDVPAPRPPATPAARRTRAPQLAASSLIVVASVMAMVGLGWATGVGREPADQVTAPPPAERDGSGAAPHTGESSEAARRRAREKLPFDDGDLVQGFEDEVAYGDEIVQDLGTLPVTVAYEDVPVAKGRQKAGQRPRPRRSPTPPGQVKKLAAGAPAAAPPAVPAPPAKPTCTTTRQTIKAQRVSYRRKVVRVPRRSFVRRTRIHRHVTRFQVRVPVVIRWTTRTRRGKIRRHQRTEYRLVWRRRVVRHPHVRRVRVVRMVKRVRRVRVVTPTQRVRVIRRCG